MASRDEMADDGSPSSGAYEPSADRDPVAPSTRACLLRAATRIMSFFHGSLHNARPVNATAHWPGKRSAHGTGTYSRRNGGVMIAIPPQWQRYPRHCLYCSRCTIDKHNRSTLFVASMHEPLDSSPCHSPHVVVWFLGSCRCSWSAPTRPAHPGNQRIHPALYM